MYGIAEAAAVLAGAAFMVGIVILMRWAYISHQVRVFRHALDREERAQAG